MSLTDIDTLTYCFVSAQPWLNLASHCSASECGDLGRTMVSHTVGLDGVGKALEMLSNYQEMEPEFDRSDHAIKILVEP